MTDFLCFTKLYCNKRRVVVDMASVVAIEYHETETIPDPDNPGAPQYVAVLYFAGERGSVTVVLDATSETIRSVRDQLIRSWKVARKMRLI